MILEENDEKDLNSESTENTVEEENLNQNEESVEELNSDDSKEQDEFADNEIADYDDSNASGFDKFFGITKRGSTLRTEILAGIVTFLSMCYILTLNPTTIVGSGSNLWGSVFIATALGAVVGTLLMALLAKMPLAQASGLGLNSMVSNAMLGYLVAGKVYSFGNIMLLVFISGIIFILLSVVPYKRDKETGRLVAIREAIYTGMPVQLRTAISVGIGLFITIIGLVNCGIIGAKDNSMFWTTIDLLPFNSKAVWEKGGAGRTAMVMLFALFVIAILQHYKVKGAVIIGILAGTLLAWPLGATSTDILLGKTDGASWKFWENFKNFFSLSQDEGGTFFVIFTEGFKNFPEGSLFGSIVVVITFCMIDMFDTMGTVVGCCSTAKLMDDNGMPHNYNKIMLSDSIATCAGAVLGTSTVTTFVESGSGIAAGGKTGVTALTAAVLFFLSIFLMPIFKFIPSCACAAALVYVGVLMMSNVKHVDFLTPKYAIPAFMTIIFMPFGYSITDGIGMGVLSFVIINFICYIIDVILYKNGVKEEKPKFEISVVLAIVAALFVIYFFVPTSF